MKISFANYKYKQGNWGSKALFMILPEISELISFPGLCQLKDPKPLRHNFPIKLPVQGHGPILRHNQLCFKHFGETVWPSSPSSVGCLWSEIDVWPAWYLSRVGTGFWVLSLIASGSVNINVILLPLCGWYLLSNTDKISFSSSKHNTQFKEILCFFFFPPLLYCFLPLLLIPFIIMWFGLAFHSSINSFQQ